MPLHRASFPPSSARQQLRHLLSYHLSFILLDRSRFVSFLPLDSLISKNSSIAPASLLAKMQLTTFTFIFAAAELVAGHGAIIAATGNAGGTGMALGIDTSTPRDGTRRRPFQQDSTRFRGDAAETFGETLGGGNNQLEAGTAAIMAETGDQLPQVVSSTHF